MALVADEQIRRKELEAIAEYLTDKNGRIVIDITEIRQRVLAEFTKKLDAKLKNLQDGEGLFTKFEIEIVGKNGKVRGGSGSQRNMPEYIEWRATVFKRDNYTCQECGSIDKIQAHHIKAWSGHPELRFEVDNGVTLCCDCHKKKHPHIGWMQN